MTMDKKPEPKTNLKHNWTKPKLTILSISKTSADTQGTIDDGNFGTALS
jgi:hypothetical protein